MEQQALRLENILESYAFRLTTKRIEEGLQAADELGERLGRAISQRLARGAERLANLAGRLQAANPLAILERGYAIVARERSGELVKSARQVAPGERVKVTLRRGELLCAVEQAEKG